MAAHRRFIWRLILLAGLVALLSTISLVFFRKSAVAASFWPSNALVLAFLLRGFRGSAERAGALAASFLVLVSVGLSLGGVPVIAVGYAAANMLEVAIAALTLRGEPMPLAHERTLFKLVVGAVVLGPVASSMVAGLALEVDHRGGFQGALQWLVSDMAGMAVFAPAFLAMRWPKAPEPMGARALARAAGAQLLVAAVTLAAFSSRDQHLLLFAISPALVLAVWTGRAAGGAIAVALAATIGALMTALGYGPLPGGATPLMGPVVILQAIVATQVLTVHPLAMALARLDAHARTAERGRFEAERRSEQSAELLAQVSHDIRSPLTGVLGMAELMRNGALGELTPSQKDGITRIAGCAAEMQRLAGELLEGGGAPARLKTELQDRTRKVVELPRASREVRTPAKTSKADQD